jgi:hypothetical protein
VVEEALAGLVGLDPLSVDDELRDGALADVEEERVDGAGSGFDVDFGEGDVVLGEEALGLAAVAAPVGGVDEKFHESIVSDAAFFFRWRRLSAMWRVTPGRNTIFNYMR